MAGTEELEARVDQVEGKVDRMAASIDARFDAVDAAFVEQRQYTEFAFERIDVRFNRLERKVDQLIDHLIPPPAAGSE